MGCNIVETYDATQAVFCIEYTGLSYSLSIFLPTPLISSFLLIVSVAIWGKFFSLVKFLPYHLFLSPTTIAACIFAGSVFVVNDLGVTEISYISNRYTMGSCLWSILVGFCIRKTRALNWICLGFAVPFTVLSVSPMLKIRQPDVNISYIIMCQIFIPFAGHTVVICKPTVAIAFVSHQYVAVTIAIKGIFAKP
ncbi:hypothetical protein BKA56DRAFT_666977 [Ilyonectria sp. MPI-CAGE-AT-0026]|nr:hypothetical protein BKA56DRAFT_666977 [Ilyonectria sp. MPI-CAGE-AT-0026]